eukprot:4085601-Prymnesium_polylepis.1
METGAESATLTLGSIALGRCTSAATLTMGSIALGRCTPAATGTVGVLHSQRPLSPPLRLSPWAVCALGL